MTAKITTVYLTDADQVNLAKIESYIKGENHKAAVSGVGPMQEPTLMNTIRFALGIAVRELEKLTERV